MQKEFQENDGEEEFPDSIEEEEKMNDYMLHPKKGTMDMFVKKKQDLIVDGKNKKKQK